MRRLLLAGAIVLTGCGGTATTTASRTTSAPTGTASAVATVPRHLDPRFLVLGNFVCRTVRTGAPGPLTPASARRALVSHATSAIVPARRAAVSLERLAAETSHQTAIAPLIAGYRALSRLYRSALAPRLTPAQTFAVARTTIETEQLTGATARSLGLGACAPAPPGR